MLSSALALTLLGGQSKGGLPVPKLAVIQDQDKMLDKIIDSINFTNMDIREAIARLCNLVGAKYKLDNTIQGRVTLSLKNIRFEMALQAALKQVEATYRFDGKSFDFVKRGTNPTNPPDTSTSAEIMPTFIPGEYTCRYDLRSKANFASTTIGGTYDLLVRAFDRGQFERWTCWSYGKEGFAVVLPFEGIDHDGRPLKGRDRFRIQPTYMSRFDLRHAFSYMAAAVGSLNFDYRVIVFVATTEPIRTKGTGSFQDLLTESGFTDLPSYMKREKWKGDLAVSALVYEFRRQNNSDSVRLVRSGQSGLTARNHLFLAGLYASDVR